MRHLYTLQYDILCYMYNTSTTIHAAHILRRSTSDLILDLQEGALVNVVIETL